MEELNLKYLSSGRVSPEIFAITNRMNKPALSFRPPHYPDLPYTRQSPQQLIEQRVDKTEGDRPQQSTPNSPPQAKSIH